MNQQYQIEQLEKSNRELKRQIELQAKQIEALKTAPAQSDEERFAPYQGAGWTYDSITDHAIYFNEGRRKDYFIYSHRTQAEWEHKATQVRRKLQRICAVLGPAESGKGYGIMINKATSFLVSFARGEDARLAEQILGYDLQYLDWNNSPEARDAREGRV